MIIRDHLLCTCDAYVPLSSVGVKKLCDLLGDKNIKEVELECFMPEVFAVEHFDQLATAIIANKNITRLTLLGPNTLGDRRHGKERMACAKAIQRILEQGSLVAFELDTDQRHHLEPFGDVIWGMFASALEHHPRLKQLTFSFSPRLGGMEYSSTRALQRILFNNTQIEELILDSCTWHHKADYSRMFQQLEDNDTLKYLRVTRAHFGTKHRSDDALAYEFFSELKSGVFENTSLRSVITLPQPSHPRCARNLNSALVSYVAENYRACTTRGLVFMFCLREAPEDSPLALLRGFPFESTEFPLVSYVKEARGWVPRKAHRSAPPDRKRKDAPSGDAAEGQSATKRSK